MLLLLNTNIPFAPSPSRFNLPSFITVILPSSPFPNSFPTTLPLESCLYESPKSPIDLSPPTLTVPSFFITDLFTAYIPTAFSFTVFDLFISISKVEPLETLILP